MRSWTERVLRRLPVLPRKSASSPSLDSSARDGSQALIASIAMDPTGTTRVLPPLPKARTSAPLRSISARLSAQSSATRNPEE